MIPEGSLSPLSGETERFRKGATLKDVCAKLHKDFIAKFRYARVWGSARYPGLKMRSIDYEVKDKDVVELHLG